MNAGAHGGEMKDVVVKTLYMTRTGRLKRLRMSSTGLIQDKFDTGREGIALKSRQSLLGDMRK